MSEKASVLIIEDDLDLQELIELAGKKKGYSMKAFSNGLEAKGALENGLTPPDLIILDINMPGMDGLTFCRWLRRDYPKIPVIFLSARAEEYDKILALEIGGDDYLTKPFSMEELFARIAVSLRRIALFQGSKSESEDSQILKFQDIEMDPNSWTCHYQGVELIFTVSEFRILQRLLTHKKQVMSREVLAEAAFPEDHYNNGRSIDVHIYRIRQKFQSINESFNSIESVYQVGYRWKG